MSGMHRPSTADLTPASDPPAREIFSGSFIALLISQFSGALNDATMRFVLPETCKAWLPERMEALAIALPAICFLVPWILLSPVAGYLADRFSKQRVLLACKFMEFACVGGLIAALLSRRIEAIGVVAFVFAATLALNNPSKLGSIPDMVRTERVSAANALVAFVTVIALITGFAYSGKLYEETFPAEAIHGVGPVGDPQWELMALVMGSIGLVGFVAAMFVKRQPPADREAVLSWNFPRTMVNDLRVLQQHKALTWVVCVYAFYWALGTLAQLTTLSYAPLVPAMSKAWSSALLGFLALGAGVGSAAAGVLSAGLVEIGLVAPAGFIFSFSAMSLFWTSGSYFATAAALFGMGFGGGMINVPLYSYIQTFSPKERRGTILAANNFVAFIAMLAATGFFYVVLSPETFDKDPILQPRGVFLAAGLISLPVALLASYFTFSYAARAVIGSLFRCFYSIRAPGRENLPPGGALLVCNHLSWLDGLLIGITCPRSPRMVAYADYVQSPLVGWFSRMTRIIPIVPGTRQAVKAIQEARDALRNGEYVCVFAEGVLSRTGQLLQFQPGLLKILKDSGAPVVPIYLDGLWGSIFTYSQGRFFWKKPQGLRRTLTVNYGPPLPGVSDVATVRRAVESLGQEAVRRRKPKTMILTRKFLRECRRSLRRSKVADSMGGEMNGGTLLLRTLILKRILEREVISADEEHVGILLPPSVGAVLANTALALAKRKAVNLNYTVTSDVMNACIRQAGIRHVLTSRRVMEKLDLKLEAEIVYLEDFKPRVTTADKLLGALDAYVTPVWLLERKLGLLAVEPDDVLSIIFTSGSTGEPKGVMLTYDNVGSNVDAIDHVVYLRQSDVIAGILPFFHSFGFTVTLWTILTLPPKGVYHFSPLDARQIGELIEKHGATILLATPTFLRSYIKRCTKEQFKTLDVVVVGAEKLTSDLADAFEKQFGVRPSEGYGCTELSPLVSVNVPASRAPEQGQAVAKEGTVGRPVPGVAAKITDLDTGAELAAEQPGMLWIKGPNVMLGYLHQPQKTDEVIRDGWYMTGDVALLDKDGFIKITGRESRFSKIGGEMVPHIKIEEALAKIVGASEDEIKVVVTAVPDEKRGERIVVVHTKLDKTPDAIVKELQAAGIPNLWIPGTDSFLEVEAIPVLGTGKLDLRGLKTVALERYGR